MTWLTKNETVIFIRLVRLPPWQPKVHCGAAKQQLKDKKHCLKSQKVINISSFVSMITQCSQYKQSIHHFSGNLIERSSCYFEMCRYIFCSTFSNNVLRIGVRNIPLQFSDHFFQPFSFIICFYGDIVIFFWQLLVRNE